MSRNYYVDLKVSRDATQEEIKHAYKEAARRLHPDVNPEPGSSELFIRIQEAYEALSNDQKRTLYDMSIGLDAPYSPSVTVSQIFSRQKIYRLEDSQLFYALMEFSQAASLEEPKNAPLNIALVLDRSTSMQGEKMDKVKTNAVQLIRQLKPKDVISVIGFSDTAEVIASAIHPSDTKKLEARISLLQPGGSTEILHGLETGLNEIRKNLNPNFINHIILITDGHTYGDEEACFELANEAAEQGIGISGLGLGERWNDQFLDKLTGFSGGSSSYISLPKDLHQYLEEKFSHLSKILAENVVLEFVCHKNVDLKYVFRLGPEPSPLQTASPLKMGSLLTSSPLTIIFEFMIHSMPVEIKDLPLAKGRIMMEVPSKPVPVERLFFDISLPVDDSFLYEPPNPSILNAMSRLSLYRMQDKARQEVMNGDISQATRHLQYLATHLLSRGERDLAHTVLVEAEHIQKSHQYSNEGDKRIKYGTRSLLLPAGTENENL